MAKLIDPTNDRDDLIIELVHTVNEILFNLEIGSYRNSIVELHLEGIAAERMITDQDIKNIEMEQEFTDADISKIELERSLTDIDLRVIALEEGTNE